MPVLLHLPAQVCERGFVAGEGFSSRFAAVSALASVAFQPSAASPGVCGQRGGRHAHLECAPQTGSA